MSEKLPFLRLIARKLNVNAKQVASFLQIDKRTLYNYANYTIEELPTIVKERFIDFFQEYDEFKSKDLSVIEIYSILEGCTDDSLKEVQLGFTGIAEQNKRSNQKQNRNQNVISKGGFDLLQELLLDFGILVDRSKLSKGYLYSLFEVVFAKVKNENDYQLLEYINKYTKN